MERIKKTAKGTGKVMLAVLAGVFMPVLIWAAMGVAVRQAQARRHQRVTAPAAA